MTTGCGQFLSLRMQMRPCYPCRVSLHLPITLVRFLLVGLMVAARLLCPCPTVDAAHAFEPQKAHSCCDEPKTGHSPSSKADHPDKTGCPNCPDAPQLKPVTAEAPDKSLAFAFDNFSPISSFSIVSPVLDSTGIRALFPAQRPQQLIFLRSVVLLI